MWAEWANGEHQEFKEGDSVVWHIEPSSLVAGAGRLGGEADLRDYYAAVVFEEAGRNRWQTELLPQLQCGAERGPRCSHRRSSSVSGCSCIVGAHATAAGGQSPWLRLCKDHWLNGGRPFGARSGSMSSPAVPPTPSVARAWHPVSSSVAGPPPAGVGAERHVLSRTVG